MPNPHPDRDYEVSLEIPEFTCLCPVTGQPDFATIRVRYVPDRHLVELKSIKLYIWSYRNEGAFHEDVTNRILDDFVAAAAPRWIEVVGDFNVRGGIKTVVRATHGKRPDALAAPGSAAPPPPASPAPPARCPAPSASRGTSRTPIAIAKRISTCFTASTYEDSVMR